ncbi:MAG: RNA-binding transcriptional accessory protein [Pseudomonadales bacterium]|nr:RNA-binding transcriptional accessory protein [Pseudomonadales bacterium]
MELSLNISQLLADELGLALPHVNAAIDMLDDGATVPFIARYRKEQTGEMSDESLRNLQTRLSYLREFKERREVVLKSIDEQGKLTAELKKLILAAQTKTALEDLYLPYKPKRRTKGQIAIEAGLEPLAASLLENPELEPTTEAEKFLNSEAGFEDTDAVLQGAKYILMEQFAENAELLANIREQMWQKGEIRVKVVEGKESEGEKFRDYFDFNEKIKKIPSHRMLAVLRGRKEGFLNSTIDLDYDEALSHPCEAQIALCFGITDNQRPADKWLKEVVRWCWRIKLSSSIEVDLMVQLRQASELEAIEVFASNLHDLLLAAPAGPRVTLGLDPAYRTGVKTVVIDQTGKVLDHVAIFPHKPQGQWDKSLAELTALCKKHKVDLIAIGNGTASRETDQLALELIKKNPELDLTKLVVSEAGASVYSASELASQEFPDLDVTVRGAISIARRLQDPLAELVKVDPKAIGVGQYQHDVNQTQLAGSLDNVVEDCVNAVGVDLNTASAALLSRVSGMNKTVASNVIEFREQNGLFKNRKELLKVPRLGEKAFELAAGFLRVRGDNPLDNSSVHPESYSVVTAIAAGNDKSVVDILGDKAFLRKLKPGDYVSDAAGEPTVRDIIAELEKPGRDPRPEFKTASFQEGVEKLSDLKEDMILEGVITNVTNFGAFVDVGVHQDGLVHISALSEQFIKDPRSVVKAGDVVKVKVMAVDVQRKRIGLSMRLSDQAQDAENKADKNSGKGRADSQRGKPGGAGKSQNRKANNKNSQPAKSQQPTGAMANALAAALAKK